MGYNAFSTSCTRTGFAGLFPIGCSLFFFLLLLVVCADSPNVTLILEGNLDKALPGRKVISRTRRIRKRQLKATIYHYAKSSRCLNGVLENSQLCLYINGRSILAFLQGSKVKKADFVLSSGPDMPPMDIFRLVPELEPFEVFQI